MTPSGTRRGPRVRSGARTRDGSGLCPQSREPQTPARRCRPAPHAPPRTRHAPPRTRHAPRTPRPAHATLPPGPSRAVGSARAGTRSASLARAWPAVRPPSGAREDARCGEGPASRRPLRAAGPGAARPVAAGPGSGRGRGGAASVRRGSGVSGAGRTAAAAFTLPAPGRPGPRPEQRPSLSTRLFLKQARDGQWGARAALGRRRGFVQGQPHFQRSGVRGGPDAAPPSVRLRRRPPSTASRCAPPPGTARPRSCCGSRAPKTPFTTSASWKPGKAAAARSGSLGAGGP